MKKRNTNRKITLLIFTVMVFGIDVAGVVSADVAVELGSLVSFSTSLSTSR